MSQEVIGTCSNCSGNVVVERGPLGIVGAWPEPRCVKCGATPKKPTIEMGTPTIRKWGVT